MRSGTQATSSRALAVLSLVLTLVGCANNNPDQLPGFFNLQYQLTSFYEARAQERSATCNLPEMSLTRADVISDDGKVIVLNVTYFWQDHTYGDTSDMLASGGGGCFGHDTRQFVVARRDGGGYAVNKMSGPQRS